MRFPYLYFLLRATPHSLVHHLPKENKAAILAALHRRLRGQRLPEVLTHPSHISHAPAAVVRFFSGY